MKVWLYARVSTKKLSQEQSPERQLANLQTAAERAGHVVEGWGIDRASGGRREKRPALASAMEAIRTGRAGGLYAERMARLGRSVPDLWGIVEEVRAAGGHIILANGTIDTTTALGRLLFTISAAVDQFQRELTVESVTEGLRYARDVKGKRLGRPPVALPRAARRLAFELRTGMAVKTGAAALVIVTWRQIAARLAEAGFTRVSGGRVRPHAPGTVCANLQPVINRWLRWRPAVAEARLLAGSVSRRQESSDC